MAKKNDPASEDQEPEADPGDSLVSSTDDGGKRVDLDFDAPDSDLAQTVAPIDNAGMSYEQTPPEAQHEEMVDELRDDVDEEGEGEVLGEATLEPIPPPSQPETRVPDASFDVAPLSPEDSEEAWKEKEKVATGVPAPDGQDDDGTSSSSSPRQDPIEAAGLHLDSATRTVSENPDGTLAYGLGPNATVISPDEVPAPINPASSADAAKKRTIYENLINQEAAAFARGAEAAYIEAKLAGQEIRIVIGDQDTPDDLDDAGFPEEG